MSSGSESAPANQGFDDVQLVGKLVRLRPTRASDAALAYPLIHDNQHILRWLIWTGPASQKELAHTYGIDWPEKLRAGTKYPFAIEQATRPGFMGCIDARPLSHPGQFEAGYWLAEPFWGRGYMTEALSLLCHFCFAHLGAQVIEAGVFAGNGGSRIVQEKNGFRFDGTLRRAVCKGETWIDLWHSTLPREEWEGRRFRPASEVLVSHNPQTDSKGLSR
jgi:[ribosomal protein S5]-alanine N-acetyltransferase